MGSIDTISFDLDGTLVTYERSPAEVLAASFRTCDLPPFFDVEQYYERFRMYLRQSASMAELRRQCFGELAVEAGYTAADGHAVAAAFDRFRDQSKVHRKPGATEVLETLRSSYTLVIVTNGVQTAQQQKLTSTGLGALVDAVVIAGDTHSLPPKPDPAPFHRVTKAVDTQPTRTVHVGDSIEADVRGAQQAGCRAVHIDAGSGTTPIQPAARVTELADLPETIDALAGTNPR